MGVKPAYNPYLSEPTYPVLQGGVVDFNDSIKS
jgi:hypothetical protein